MVNHIKTCLWLVLLLATVPMQGQSAKFHFGFTTQAGISDLVFRYEGNPGVEQFFNESANPRFSPGFGGVGQYQMSEAFLLQAGLGFSLTGYRVKESEISFSTPNNPEPEPIGTARGVVNYRDLQFSLHVKAMPFRSLRRFYFCGGLRQLLNVGRDQNVVIHFYDGTVQRSTESIDGYGRKFRSYNLCVDLGLGYSFKLGTSSSFFVEPFFGYYVFPVFVEGKGEYRQYSTGIQVGYLF